MCAIWIACWNVHCAAKTCRTLRNYGIDASKPKLGASKPQNLRAPKGPCYLTHTPHPQCTSLIPHTSSSAQGQDLYQLSGSDAENLTCAENALVCTTPMQR